MLNVERLKEFCKGQKVGIERLAERIARGGFDKKKAIAAIKNWQKGLLKPKPTKEDIQHLAEALAVEANDLSEWHSFYRYAPGSARKAHLVTQLITGRSVQDAMDILKFTRKRAAPMIEKVLKTAVADADEQQADVDNLYVSKAYVEEAGVRIGTKRFRAKDRGRAHSIRQRACHIHVTVSKA
jgi:large subunit ribosomal protein L22